ncbi:hypothetical protein [Methylobacterium sp. E-045]|uniref:hypothetical protein n=1 Tax=Methylobacterium sp. E-045 TaxID=2836575 RepID=UPI001FBB0A82|nr:hypothetical protein [Methylobacterium sp. E-045]MCJ2131326.1 hypothetical protein [Methylobacterium sp. E-045]
MPLGDDLSPSHGMNAILARFVSGLWQGQDQFVVMDAEMIRAYGTTSADPLLLELGEGWSAARQKGESETVFTRIIPARRALERLGF